MAPRSLCLAVLLAVMLLPATSAQDEQEFHRLILEGSEVRFVEPMNITRLVEINVGPPTDTNCGNDQVQPREDGGFTFNETGTAGAAVGSTGCAEALYDMTFPAAATVRVMFRTDRRIQDPGNQGIPATQEFRLHLPDGERREDVFPPSERSQPAKDYVRTFALPAGTTNITLGWFFHDTGLSILPPTEPFPDANPGSQAFAADVWNVSVDVRGIAVPMDPLDPAGPETRSEDGSTASADLWLNFSLPASLFATGRQPTVLLDLRAGPVLVDAQGPRGAIPLAAVQANVTQDRTLLALRPAAFVGQGTGDYSLRFVSTRTIPPPPTPGKPTTIEPFYYTMLALPAPAAALAVYSGIAYRREAEGRYLRPATGILAFIMVGAVYYLLLVVYAVFGAGKRIMTTLPLEPEATLVYIQLIVLLLFFIVTAVVVGRYLAGAMRRDIEQRRAQEERLRRSNEELERFAYVASHDLQEPLRKVAGFTSLLQRRYKGRLDKDADEMIQYAVDGATRMQALIRDILAYSRVGSTELDVKPVDVSALLELVVADLGEKVKDEKAQITWGDLPTLQADAGQLRQVLQNLVENAIKYRHPNRRPKVRIAAERDRGMWRISVADNGVGIPADKLNEVFGIFRRLHGNNVPGTGIGLALAKKAVERHGGKIWVESRMGKGSTFYFTFPASDESAPRPAWRIGVPTSSATAPAATAAPPSDAGA